MEEEEFVETEDDTVESEETEVQDDWQGSPMGPSCEGRTWEGLRQKTTPLILI